MKTVYQSPVMSFSYDTGDTPPEGMRVSFVIGGTQKGGTTTLDACLRHHPALRMGRNKELHYFDDEAHFADPPDYDAYHRGFDHGRARQPLPRYGDATPIYMWWKPAAPRIRAYNPDMKWILLLRNPIDRAYSNWNMQHRRGKEPLAFMDALLAESDRLAQVHPGQHRTGAYVDRGRYAGQIRRLWTHFRPEQFLILKSEDLKHDLQGSVNRVCAFLEVPALHVPENFGDQHVLPYDNPMSDSARAWLREQLEPEIHDLEQLLGWDCRNWLDR